MRIKDELNQIPGPFDGQEKNMPGYTDAAHARLHDILLDQLRLIDAHFWPGADGLTIDAVLAGYAQAAAAGQVPGLVELAGKYPELAAKLEEVFAHPCERASCPIDSSSGGPSESGQPFRLD
jgi:hypothetical protein